MPLLSSALWKEKRVYSKHTAKAESQDAARLAVAAVSTKRPIIASFSTTSGYKQKLQLTRN